MYLELSYFHVPWDQIFLCTLVSNIFMYLEIRYFYVPWYLLFLWTLRSDVLMYLEIRYFYVPWHLIFLCTLSSDVFYVPWDRIFMMTEFTSIIVNRWKPFLNTSPVNQGNRTWSRKFKKFHFKRKKNSFCLYKKFAIACIYRGVYK